MFTIHSKYQNVEYGIYNDRNDDNVELSHNLFSGFDFSKCGNNMLIYGKNEQYI